MLYNPPAKWTEELLDELPFGEDDRYEWKSGDEISSGDNLRLQKFFETLATEIGAFANSFGGTLFIGLDDKSKDKIGIPDKKGKTPIERWFENKIPTLLELRLQHYRVSRVELTLTTQSKIGNNVIIAIDVFDSELAPHQCIFDHKYYYRSNSSSVPAPHHYLAFLWGRINSNMPQVATWWLKDFLVPLIHLIDDLQKKFNENNFLLNQFKSHPYVSIIIYKIVFFEPEKWDKLISSNVGEYFLSTFPLIEKELTSFRSDIDEFLISLNELEKTIEKSLFFHQQLISFYERMISNHRIPRSDYENLNVEQLAVRILGQLQMQLSNDSTESKNSFIRFTAYSLLELNIYFPENTQIEYHNPLNICKELFSELKNNDNSVAKSANNTKQLFEKIKNESICLWRNLKRERIDIAKRYTATFG